VTESGFCVTGSFPVMSEYKVNPHIRKKQALDMDLVLICQKRPVSFKPTLLSLDELVQRAMDGLPVEASNGSKNRLFLHFMGELLKVASTVWDQDVTYEWFADVLSRFDDLVIKGITTKTHTKSERSNVVQSELF
jgi:hypothetical protein